MACHKIQYETWEEAQKIVNRLRRIRIYSGGRRIKGSNLAKRRPKRVYKCPVCGFFHLTHYKNKQKCHKKYQ